MPKVTFHHSNGQVETHEGKEGESLLKIALDHRIPMENACGGNGFCTTCMCKVQQGMEHLNARNDREENMGITSDPYRLSCQSRLKGSGDVEIEVLEV